MSIERYSNRGIVNVSKRDMFKQVKQLRKLDSINLIATAKINNISQTDLEDLDYDAYIWGRGDRFYKLAFEFYGTPEYWWVIALFNNAPTEQHVDLGEEIFIPRDPELVAALLGGEQ
tara:strand:+ start:589 stop:939 length:351 start_codon:yes stop_codon:yes gene_type:complete